jgi:ubiquinone/menaquinone biosynthesis C-methylase UbiE
MKTGNLDVRDYCRQNLVPYTLKAVNQVSLPSWPGILDMGCGTGVITIHLAKKITGTICAVDNDPVCLRHLRHKIHTSGMNEWITVIEGSLLEPGILSEKFDLVLAEVLLNVTGFENGLSALLQYTKDSGFLIIHDEFSNDEEKRARFRELGLILADSFILDETVWWEEYYGCLEREIEKRGEDELFKRELREIEMYREDPSSCKSIYYILHKTGSTEL